MKKLTAFIVFLAAALAAPAAALGAPGPQLIQTLAPLAETGEKPVDIASGDFDEDGTLDVATANAGSGDITVALGTGEGFKPATTPNLAIARPAAIAATDLNGDGNLDLAVASATDDEVRTLTGNGSGAFAAGSTIPVGEGPDEIETGDLDADGRIDLFTTNGRSEDVTVVFGDGAAGAGAAITLKTAIPNCTGDCVDPADLVAAELTGDALLDLAVVEELGYTAIFRNDGARAFTQLELIESGSFPAFITSGRLNADGATDLAVADGFDTFSAIALLADGAGAFESERTNGLQDNGSPNSLDAADVDLDGDVDLVMTDDLRYLALYLNRGDGSFAGPRYRPAGRQPSAAAVADFDSDGRPDLAIAHRAGDIALFRNQERPDPPTPVRLELKRYSAADGKFFGVATSKDPACMRGTVQLFRAKKGNDAYEGGDDGADSNGRFELRFKGIPDGSYYAQINRREVPTGLCRQARSNRLRVG